MGFQQKIHARNILILLFLCIGIFSLALILRPHGCKSTYGPPPYHYNTDLILWIKLAEQPIHNLGDSILSNRPIFAYLAWLFSQPTKVIVGDRSISGPTRDGRIAEVQISTIIGLLLANSFCFFISSVFIYHFTNQVFNNPTVSLISAMLWSTSSYAFAWSYHPTNQMGGQLIIFAFPYFLFLLTKKPTILSNISFGLGFGLLLLMKAYYVLPFIYLVWALIHKFNRLHILIAFLCFFIPTLLWRILFEQITGLRFVDFHLGTKGITGELVQFLLPQNFTYFMQNLISNFVKFLSVLSLSTGPFLLLLAIIFFSIPGNFNVYRPYFLLAGIYIPLFFLFLTMSGFFIPRHGSDFFPFIFPAAGYILWDFLNKNKHNTRLIIIAISCVMLSILISYSQPWICASEFM